MKAYQTCNLVDVANVTEGYLTKVFAVIKPLAVHYQKKRS